MVEIIGALAGIATIVALYFSIKTFIRENKKLKAERNTIVQGLRLFQHEGYYPIDIIEETGEPKLNSITFVNCIRYLLHDCNDRLAAMDLVYLREDNIKHDHDFLNKDEFTLYKQLISKYDLHDFLKNFKPEKDLVLQNFIRLVNDIGATFENTFSEILLHDVRNPIHSIVAARNTKEISNRNELDPSTRFVVQFVRNQGKMLIEAMESGSKIAYLKHFNKTKNVKATTTPLYHERYGLVAILCINIDIDRIQNLSVEDKEQFFKDYMKNSGIVPKFEMDNRILE